MKLFMGSDYIVTLHKVTYSNLIIYRLLIVRFNETDFIYHATQKTATSSTKSADLTECTIRLITS